MRREILALIALAAMVGCSKSGDNSSTESGVVSFYAEEIGTRVSAANQWESGDMIGIYSEGFSMDCPNVKYTATTEQDADKTSFSAAEAGTEILYDNVKSGTVTFYAYYPYTSEVDMSSGNVWVDIASQSNDLGAVDFISAKSVVNYGAGQNDNKRVELEFVHRLAKVVMNITPNEDVESLTGLTATLKGVNTKGAYSALTMENSILFMDDEVDLPLNVVVADDGMNATVTAILHPTTYSNTLSFELNGESYSATLSATFDASCLYNYNMKLGHEIGGFQQADDIKNWVGSETTTPLDTTVYE